MKRHGGNRDKIDRKYSGGEGRETVERRGAKQGFPLPHDAGTLGQSAERLTPSISAYVKRIGKTNCRIAGLQKTVTYFNQTM